jgi:hypothetical protein
MDMITAKNLVEIDELIERWERGEGVWSDPPLCSLLVSEIARLRTLLRDVFPFVVGTPMQEEVRAEMSEDASPDAGPSKRRRRSLPALLDARGSRERRRTTRAGHA